MILLVNMADFEMAAVVLSIMTCCGFLGSTSSGAGYCVAVGGGVGCNKGVGCVSVGFCTKDWTVPYAMDGLYGTMGIAGSCWLMTEVCFGI